MQVITRRFAPSGGVPNHPAFPLIVYGGVLDGGGPDPAADFEALFGGHGWGRGWRNGVFAYQHFHADVHEVLGIAAGRARIRFGGEDGEAFDVSGGDAVLIPAGVGHMRLAADSDFLVVGAYPPGAPVDLQRDGGALDPDHVRRVARVARPDNDPVAGQDGPMHAAWPA